MRVKVAIASGLVAILLAIAFAALAAGGWPRNGLVAADASDVPVETNSDAGLQEGDDLAAGEWSWETIASLAGDTGLPLLPERLPDGQTSGAPFLDSVVLTGKGSARTWTLGFSIDALPPAKGNITGYSIYQVDPSRDPHRCVGAERAVRVVADSRISICLGPNPTDEARRYWSTVPLSSDMTRVTWLPNSSEEKAS